MTSSTSTLARTVEREGKTLHVITIVPCNDRSERRSRSHGSPMRSDWMAGMIVTTRGSPMRGCCPAW
jgi:hypothetical protein